MYTKPYFKTVLIILTLALLFTVSADAQCAMCRAVLESEEDTSTAEGINNGIVYLMSLPYVLFFGLAYMLYRKYGRTKD